jgi:hypothetical protein
MGAWGTGVYENDAAADWANLLAKEGLSAVETSLEPIAPEDYLEQREGARAIAAADVVARLRSGGGERSAFAEPVTGWIEANGDVEWQHLVAPARAALQRCADPENSEIYEEWADAEQLDEWQAVLTEVRGRLG